MKVPDIKYKVSQIEQSKEYKGFEDIKNDHASNSWVVHGNYTKSGKPIFSNDPHMKNGIPIVNYIVKLYIDNEEQFKKRRRRNNSWKYARRGSFSCYRE